MHAPRRYLPLTLSIPHTPSLGSLTSSQTIITTRYHIKPARRRTKAEKQAGSAAAGAEGVATPATATKPPRGHLVIKTYDPVSGVSLKYKTSKAAEVGRLVQMLGGLGRRMAALPALPAGEAMGPESGDAMVSVLEGESGTQTPVPGTAGQATGTANVPSGAGGAKGKKKKGKR